MECLNWPPSRGPNPHTHKEVLKAGTMTKKILPAPPEPEIAAVEKETIGAIMSGDRKRLRELGIDLPRGKIEPLKIARTFSRNTTVKKPLIGRWKVWYQVADVVELTLAQASTFVTACRLDGKQEDREHLDTWWDYEPRPLWVDITYPLKRGVRLLVKPMIRTWIPCKACNKNENRKNEPLLTPGYLLWMIAREYEQIYEDHEKYGVWGHAMEDLGFESITIDKEGVVRLGIGS